MGNTIRSFDKSRDTSGYVLIVDLSSAIRVYDLTVEPYSAASHVLNIGHQLGANWRLIAASPRQVTEFGTMDSNTYDDAQLVVLTGTSASYGFRFVDACPNISNSLVSLNGSDFYLLGCWDYGIAIMNFNS